MPFGLHTHEPIVMADEFTIEGERYFKRIADALPTLMWMADKNGKVNFRNKQWYDYCGVTSEMITSEDWSIHYDPAIYQHLLKSWQHSISTGEEFRETFLLRGKDGHYRYFSTHAVPIKVDGKVVRWIGTSVDVSEHVRVEKQLRESEESLRKLNQRLENIVEERAEVLRRTEEQLRQSQKMEAVGQLTGGLAHDFNNMLAGIMGNLELLQLRLDQGRFDDVGRFVQNAQAAGHRAAALTQRLLAFSRRQVLDPKPVLLLQLINSMKDLIKRTIGPNVTLTMEPHSHEGVVLIDSSQLENALLNLCINARDAMPDGGKILIDVQDVFIDPIRAAVFDVRFGNYLQIRVKDNGCGMDLVNIDKAFDPFFTTKPIGQGTGLGLSMVYGFSRQSKGHVTIESVRGEGTTVTIYLPKHETLVVPEYEPPEVLNIVASSGRILLVDDEKSILNLLEEVLTDTGYEVTTAADGVEALKILESDAPFDLLITDVGLPNGMNGRQVADVARNLRKAIKVLFITGYAEKAVMDGEDFNGDTEILIKPFTLPQLVERASKLIK